jgi:flagellar biosynthesis component FlhA
MGADERVVLLHDPEVRQLIEGLAEALAVRVAVLADLETPDGAAELERLVERAREALARD